MASWPPFLRADAFAAMLNFEIADHPVYDGLELQWFDDAAHGTGMLALLGHRDSHVLDYYAQRGLRLDPADYQIGAGTGACVETDIADAFVEIADGGRSVYRPSCGWSPPSSPCSGGHRRRTGGGQSSVPAARPRAAGRGAELTQTEHTTN